MANLQAYEGASSSLEIPSPIGYPRLNVTLAPEVVALCLIRQTGRAILERTHGRFVDASDFSVDLLACDALSLCRPHGVGRHGGHDEGCVVNSRR